MVEVAKAMPKRSVKAIPINIPCFLVIHYYIFFALFIKKVYIVSTSLVKKMTEVKVNEKWFSRKLAVVIIFGFGYPIMVAQGIEIPAESLYIIIAYLLGQSAVDLLKEKLPKVGGTSGQAGTSEQTEQK